MSQGSEYTGNTETFKLLYHCGVAIESDYGPLATSSYIYDVNYAMSSYFGFITDGIKWKSSYTSNDWINLLKADIDAGRPIFYQGENSQGTTAHAWVIDGYKTTNEFHCNWGWGGSYNSWFYLTALNPGSSNYTYVQGAILGTRPILDACTGIIGKDYICSSNISYSVPVPGGASVVWNKTGNLTQVGGNTGSTYTVYATNSQSSTGTITANIYNSQNQLFLTRTKSIGTGPHVTINGINSMLKDRTRTYTLNVLSEQPITSFNWSADGGVIPVGSTTSSSFTVKGTGCGYGIVSCSYSNSCGSGNSQLDVEVICETLSMILSPNPTSDFINVNLITSLEENTVENEDNLLDDQVLINNLEKQEKSQYTGEFEIQVWNEYSGLVEKVKDKNKPKFQISLMNKPRGMYYFHLIVDGVVVQKKAIIKI